MIRIAIVDDEKEQVVMLSTCVSVFFRKEIWNTGFFHFFVVKIYCHVISRSMSHFWIFR